MSKKFKVKAVEFAQGDVDLYIVWPRLLKRYWKIQIYHAAYMTIHPDSNLDIGRMTAARADSRVHHTTKDDVLEDSCKILDAIYTKYYILERLKNREKEQRRNDAAARRNPRIISREDCA